MMAKLLQMSLFATPPGDDEPITIETVDPSVEPIQPLASAPGPLPPAHPVETQDQPAREKALAVRESFIIEAPAGSGKTGILIQRYLKLLAEGGVERPEEVLAITFTRKADAEMRRRVLQQLTDARNEHPLRPDAKPFELATRAIACAVLERDRQLGWKLLEAPQQLNIRTIDSLCAELAGAQPLIAGAGGRYQPTDDPLPLYQAAAERTLLRMGGPDPVLTRDLETLLLHRDASTTDVLRLIADMLRNREQWGELIPLTTEDLTDGSLDANILPRLQATLHRVLREELTGVAEHIGPNLLSQLAEAAHDLSRCDARGDEPMPFTCFAQGSVPTSDPEDLALWRALRHLVLTTSGSPRRHFRSHDLRCELTAEQKERLRDLSAALEAREAQQPGLRRALHAVTDLPDATYPIEQWAMVRTLCRILHAARVELQVVFADKRSCDFTEVALNARALLAGRGNTDVLNTLGGRIQHLLVDEMQDTSAGQYELLGKLTETWDGATQTVFLVGDPKQSIYEFRLARVERFRRVIQSGRFGSLQVTPLQLTANFRSSETLVQDFNSSFEHILPSPDDFQELVSPDVPFIAAQPTRTNQSPGLQWRLTSFQKGGSADEGAFEADADKAHARQIRQTIENFLEKWSEHPSHPGSARIAVLARTRAHLLPVIQAFRGSPEQEPLAFRAVDVEPLGERPEILDLLSLIRALMHPGDRIAWLALLRSPVFGLSLPDLLTLTGEAAESDNAASILSLMETRASLLSPTGQQILARSGPVLKAAVEERARTSLHTAVERTWRSLGYDATLSPSENLNAQRFLNLLADVESVPEPFHVGLLLRRIEGLYAAPEFPDAPVELMTIHKAKGLEWDLVVIPEIQRGSGSREDELLKWFEFSDNEGRSDFFLAPIHGKGEAASKLSRWMDRRKSVRAEAEAKRLFYVACTRAREELHLFGSVQLKDGTPQAPARKESLLFAAWPVAEAKVPVPPVDEPAGKLIAFPVPLAVATASVLELAAGADPTSPADTTNVQPLLRLPLRFSLKEHLQPIPAVRLPYPDASTLRRDASFQRPEGSFLARAFGNVTHRFLELCSEHMQQGTSVASLLTSLSAWETRILAGLRSEGLPHAAAAAAAQRISQLLRLSLSDPAGVWLLGPRKDARSESPLWSGPGSAGLRADRTFLAGTEPASAEDSSCLWIVDFKTTEPGGHSRDNFLEQQRAKYMPQMQSYAREAALSGRSLQQIRLALYFPALPALLYWAASESEGMEHALLG